MVLDRLPDVTWWSTAVRARMAIDARSLALFRIAAGLLIVVDVLLRSRTFHRYYTDDGIVPQALAQSYTPDGAISVYYVTSDPRVFAALFALTAIVAIVLIVGYQTRLAMLLSLLLVVSLDHHNPFVLSYADILFRLLLFWGIFLPLGERWSVDAVHRERAPRTAVAGLATFAVLAQLVTMYFVNGLHKAESSYWWDGTATPLILGMDEIAYLAGPYVRQLPFDVLVLGGRGWFALMLVSPVLLLLQGRRRYLLALLYVGGHAIFALTVRIGAFPYVAIVGLVLFFQAAAYRDGRTLARRFGLLDRLPLASYRDLRRRAIGIADRFPRLRIQSRSLRRAGRVVATGTLVLAIIAVLVIPWGGWAANAGLLPREPDPDGHVDARLEAIGIDQPEWRVFAPTPRHTDAYYVFAAATVDGEQLDVRNDRPLSYDRPVDPLYRQHETYRERFYMFRLVSSGPRTGQLDRLLQDYCERWPTERGAQLAGIVVWEISEPINVSTYDDPDSRERKARLIDQHSCTGEDLPEIEPPGFYW